MKDYIPIITHIPFFRHCTSGELENLASRLRISHVKKNQTLDLKKINAINIILEGIFQLEVLGKKDYIYLTAGSFFGDYPFAEVKNRGIIRAVSDATIAHLNCDELYAYFLINYRFLRGYIRCMESLGVDLIDSGKDLFKNRTKIVSVFSLNGQSGKSTIALSLAASLSKFGNSIALDLSYSGTSIFDIAGKKITAPLSQKEADFTRSASIINSRIEKVTDNCDILNIVHGSKVKADPSILSPLLLVLSKTYHYIILDISNYDAELRSVVFEQSDFIIGIVSDKGEQEELGTIFDYSLSDGQQVYYVSNEFFTKNIHLPGALRWGIVASGNMDNRISLLAEAAPDNLVECIIKPRTAFVMDTTGPDALHYAWFLELLKQLNLFNIFAASSFGGIPVILHILFNEADVYRKKMIDFIENVLSQVLEVQFPRETLFSPTKVEKYARSLCASARLEYMNERAAFFFAQNQNSKKIFTTGKLSDMFVLALANVPLFPPITIGGNIYHSLFPHITCETENILRMDMEKIFRVTIRGSNDFQGIRKILPWYRTYHRNASNVISGITPSPTGESHVEIDIKGLDSCEKISDSVYKQTNKFLKENRFM